MGDSTSSISGRAMRGPTVRGLELDLNVPPSDNRDPGETSSQVGLPEAEDSHRQVSRAPTMIDVDTLDDEVVESSARAFAEAKNKSRRNFGRTIVNVEADEHSRINQNNRHKRRRSPPNQTIINCDLYINLESSSNSTNQRENVTKPAAPPLKEPTFNCPICMGPLVEEMSTKCGHIFCKTCIKAAISAQGKCPTCRKKVTAKELIRVFLPATG